MPAEHEAGGARPYPGWGEVGIHGLHRMREWDAVAISPRLDLPGERAIFVGLDGGRCVVEDGAPGLDPAALAASVSLAPPFRAHATRRDDGTWAIAAVGIDTVSLTDDPPGDEIELVFDGRERSVRIDGEPTFHHVPELARLGADRHDAYVVQAWRLDGQLWEVSVSPL